MERDPLLARVRWANVAKLAAALAVLAAVLLWPRQGGEEVRVPSGLARPVPDGGPAAQETRPVEPLRRQRRSGVRRAKRRARREQGRRPRESGGQRSGRQGAGGQGPGHPRSTSQPAPAPPPPGATQAHEFGQPPPPWDG